MYITCSKKQTGSHRSQSSIRNQTQNLNEQELSYHKQIACQLRTQYVVGVYRPKYYTVTLKSRLMVSQGHWKRNHWTDFYTTYY